MFIEIWQIILVGIATAIPGWATLAVQKWMRTRSERKTAEYTADMIETDADLKRVNAETIKDTATREAVNNAYAWIDKMNEKLNEFRDDMLKAEEKIFELTKRATRAEREREYYKSALRRLVKTVLAVCGDKIDVSEFIEATE